MPGLLVVTLSEAKGLSSDAGEPCDWDEILRPLRSLRMTALLEAASAALPPAVDVSDPGVRELVEGHFVEVLLCDGARVHAVIFRQIADVVLHALAPMAVHPDFQRRGVGSALVRAGLEAARRLGHKSVVVLGHAEYYPRFGFVPARPRGIEPPLQAPDEAFMLIELVPGALAGVRGTVRYPAAYDAAL